MLIERKTTEIWNCHWHP